MKTVIPALPNYKISHLDDRIEITTLSSAIDSGTRSASIFLSIIWLLTLAIMVSFIVSTESYYKIMLFPFLLWVMAGAFWGFALFWRIKFQEKILINKDSIIVTYQAPLLNRSYQYLENHIKCLRASPTPPYTLWMGRIAFDYGGQTIYIGSRLSELEAKQILLQVQQKFANYECTT